MKAGGRTFLAAGAAALVVAGGAIWFSGRARSFWITPEVDVNVPQKVLQQMETHRELAGAKEMFLTGRTEDALAVFNRVAEEHKGTAQAMDALLHAAKCEIELNRPEEATRLCRRLLDTPSEGFHQLRGQARIELARSLVLSGKRKEGFQTIEDLITDYGAALPELCADALLAKADLYWKDGHYGLARSAYCRVIEDYPGGEHTKADIAEEMVERLRDGLSQQHEDAVRRLVQKGAGVHVTSIAAGTVRWSKGEGPYLITNVLTIPAGATLHIEPGVEVRFAIRGGLAVQGTLEASGTAEQPIRFIPIVGEARNAWFSGVRIIAVDGAAASRLSHVRIEGAEVGVDCVRGSVQLDASELTFCHVAGVSAEKDGKLTARDCTITECFRGARCVRGGALRLEGGRIAASLANGVMFQLTSEVSVHKTLVEENHRAGVVLRDGCKGAVIEATIRNNGADGILCFGESAPRIRGNIIEGNGGAGILFRDRCTLQVEGNQIRGNQAGGVRIVMGEKGRLTGNVIEGNHGPGIDCAAGSNPLIERNRIVRNTGVGVLVRPGGAARLAGNDLSGNQAGGLSNHSPNPIDARKNYWGSEVAPEVAAAVDDKQDNANWGDVAVKPWLTAAPKIDTAGGSP